MAGLDIVSNQIPSGHGSYHAHPNGFSSITPSLRPLEVPLESTHYIIIIIIIPIFHHPHQSLLHLVVNSICVVESR